MLHAFLWTKLVIILRAFVFNMFLIVVLVMYFLMPAPYAGEYEYVYVVKFLVFGKSLALLSRQ